MIRPLAMQTHFPMRIAEDVTVSTVDVWRMLTAAMDGDLETVTSLVAAEPALVDGRYDYTSPLHFAAREGHFAIVKFLAENGAVDPEYYVHPFKIDLVTLAEFRGHSAIANYLKEQFTKTQPNSDRWDTGRIDYGYDEEQVRFQEIVDKGDIDTARSMLANRPDLATLETANWGEGMIATAANGNDRAMVELLLEYGASVPDLSKWGARYYFKHLDMARFLLENGMPVDHKNWRGFTLLHDVIFTREIDKARLLLEHGADVDAVDDELSLTPLGWVEYWKRPEMTAMLKESQVS